jgi:DNA-binding PadR family transcriptional regulator
MKPEGFLPLTPVVFEIALALAAGDRHGYEIMQDVERRTDGRIVLHPGTLYRALARLLDQGLIEELDERPDDGHDDERRRYYRLTANGLEVARGEARRLEAQVDAARQRRLLPGDRA